MKKYILVLLLMISVPSAMVVNAAQYGQPYGSTDETPMEAKNIKSIDEVNEDIDPPDIQEEQTPIEQENETPMEESDGAPVSEQQ